MLSIPVWHLGWLEAGLPMLMVAKSPKVSQKSSKLIYPSLNVTAKQDLSSLGILPLYLSILFE